MLRILPYTSLVFLVSTITSLYATEDEGFVKRSPTDDLTRMESQSPSKPTPIIIPPSEEDLTAPPRVSGDATSLENNLLQVQGALHPQEPPLSGSSSGAE